MSGAKSIQVLMNRILMEETLPLDKAQALWVEVKARLSKKGCKPTIKEVEACASGNLDTHPRDIVRDAIAFVLVGAEYWEDVYAGSDFLFRFIKECVARGYIESDGSLGDRLPVRFNMMVSDGVKTFHQTVVHAKDYDALEAEVMDLRRQLDNKAVDEATQLAADRWNAVIGCQRMRVVGHAGFRPQDDAERNKAHLAGVRHVGIDFWSHHDADDGAKEHASEMLTAFADQVIANQRALQGGE